MVFVDDWIDADPVGVALKTGNQELADRVDLLQRARGKLPSYYSARAVFSRIAMEQSSSEVVAANRGYKGGMLAVDLTCGLGVDSLYLSKWYKKVIAIEIDEGRARDAAANFALIGADNIEVKNMSAEDFVATFDEVADVIFVDPARRDKNGRRIYNLAETEPDVLSMLPKIRAHCRELIIKCSPMFDVFELRKIFGQDYSVETVSLDGECKETLVRYDGSQGSNIVTVLSSDGFVWHHRFGFESKNHTGTSEFSYLICFDPALVKAAVTGSFIAELYPGTGFVQTGSYALTDRPVQMQGVTECYSITSIVPFQPARLKKEMKGKKFSVLRKGFPISMEILKRQLGFIDGGGQLVAFVQVEGRRYMLSLDGSQ